MLNHFIQQVEMNISVAAIIPLFRLIDSEIYWIEFIYIKIFQQIPVNLKPVL